MNTTADRQLLQLYQHVPHQSWFHRWFERLRSRVLPMQAIDRVVPSAGRIVEIGCGHGLIANYLAMTSAQRNVIGIDIDARRIAIAQATIAGRPNIAFRLGRFEAQAAADLDMVILFGVLCLIPMTEWATLFRAIWQSLKPGGSVLLHDIRKNDSWLFRLHSFKEKLFHVTGITRGDGLYVLPPDCLEQQLVGYGFTVTRLGRELDVPLHSCLTWLLTKHTD